LVTRAAGWIVLVPFPFSNLSQAKLRPALVLTNAGRGDWILYQDTRNPYGDTRTVELVDDNFATGSLRVASVARPGKLFTASQGLIVGSVGGLKPAALK
jgi:hypothetical protein